MEDFHPSQWVQVFRDNPVLMILLGGTVGGVALTQTLKLIWFTLEIDVGKRWYNLGVVIFATGSTYIFTDQLWLGFNLTTGTGLRHIVSLISAIAAPYTYKGTKALVATRWPNFAAKWGDRAN